MKDNKPGSINQSWWDEFWWEYGWNGPILLFIVVMLLALIFLVRWVASAWQWPEHVQGAGIQCSCPCLATMRASDDDDFDVEANE